MPKYVRKTVVLAKIETTVGTDAVPTGAANAVLVRSVSVSPMEGDSVERTLVRPYFGNFDKIQATQYMKLELEVDFSGSGAAGTLPQYDALMQICAANATVVATTSVTYAPITNSLKTASIYVNVDGVNHVLTSARGTWSATLDAKGLPVLKFSLTGIWNALTDTTLPTAVYTAVATPVPVNDVNTTLTLHGIALAASNFMIDVANTVVYRSLIGKAGVELTDRKSTFSTTFESVPIATKDWATAIKSNTTGAIAFTHGLTAGNRVAINATKAQLSSMSYSEQDAIQMIKIDGALIPTSGNDEWSIVLT